MAVTRRRFVTIAAAFAGGALLPANGVAAAREAVRWRGVVMGAEASILLYPSSREAGRALIAACRDEIERLENEFSLYRPQSSLSRLNASGALDAPSLDFYRLVEDCRFYHRASGGAFDPTVQPLWPLYAAAGSGGPTTADLAAARKLIGFDGVHATADRISYARPGMAMTFNGIAQGYVTDRVAELLRRRGATDVLLDLGEIRALGSHPDGRPWRVTVPGFGDPLAAKNEAVATSAPAGTVFDAGGRFHHLFDPTTGESASQLAQVSVFAPTATAADALSTALAIAPLETAQQVLDAAGRARALCLTLDGGKIVLRSATRGS
jgi:thiamine biosynthesis lipoprotein